MHSFSSRALGRLLFALFAILVVTGPASAVAQSNSAPVATSFQTFVAENETATRSAPGVLSNVTDADGDPLTATLVTNVSFGTLDLQPNGAWTYTPDPDFIGDDSFTFQASDGTALSNEATVTVTVNAAPVANDDAYTVTEGNTLTVDAPGLLGNDTDENGDVIEAFIRSFPSNGEFVTFEFDGSFIYEPDPGFVGQDSFEYEVRDLRGTVAEPSTATVTITVEEVNDPPIAGNDNYRVAQDGELSRSVPFSLLGNDSDPNGDALTATLVQTPSNGQLLDQDGFVFPPDGDFVYTPDPGFSGTDTFTYQVSDGELTSNEATVTIVVSEPPSAQPDAYTVARNATLEVPNPGVLANDTDPEGDQLDAELVTGPTNGELLFIQEAEGRLARTGSFTYVPDTDFTGTDTFTYRADDGLSSDETTVTITVQDVLTAQDDLYAVSEDDTLRVSVEGEGVLANDSAPGGAALTASLETSPANGTLLEQAPESFLGQDGTFTYVPNAGFIGTDTFTYLADDGTSSVSATVSITVNGRPSAQPDSYEVNEGDVLVVIAPGLLSNDTDPEDDVLTATVATSPTGGVVSSFGNDGSFSYTPFSEFNGVDEFSYVVSDATGGRDTTTVTLTVLATNDAPIADNDTYQVNEGDTLQVFSPGVLINDTDPENDDLVAILEEGPANGELVPQGTDAIGLTLDGAFTYVPNPGFRGVDQFTYRADDGSASDAAVVVITVNGRPVAQPDTYTIDVNNVLEVSAPGVLDNDADPEGDDLFATRIEGPANGTLTPQGTDNLGIAPDGGFIYTPNTDFVGTDTLVYRVSDTSGASDTAVVEIQVGALCQYTVVGLGTLGGAVSRAVDINNAGEIVGFSETSDRAVRGFIWSGGEMTTVAPDQINQTFAIDEDIAGTADIGGTFQAARFSGTETVAQGPADAFSVAFGTSGSRSAGAYVENETFVPFVNDNGVVELPVPEGGGGQALDVNADGQVAGYSVAGQALRWESGEVTDLGPGRAYGINDNGQVVGRSGARAVRWEVDGTRTVLGDDPRFAEAYDINSDGLVVGSSILVTDTSQVAGAGSAKARRASWATSRDLADLAHQMATQKKSTSAHAATTSKRTSLGAAYRFEFGIATDLNECIPDGSGWVLEEARSVNDLGQIVGFGLLNGEQQAYLLNPDVNPDVNTAPQARRGRVQTRFGESTDLEVLSHATDVDGDTLSISRVFSPEHGTLRHHRDGQYRYVPPAGYTGPDRFTYVITDGRGATAKGTMTVEVTAPKQFFLEGNAPNPVREQTTIHFTLPEAGHVRLNMYDVLGRRVAQLVNQEVSAGRHAVDVDASSLAAGVYFYRIRTEGFSETRKMIVTR